MMAQFARLLSAVCRLLFVASLAACYPIENVAIPPQNVPGSRMPSTALDATLVLPKGKPPYPAVIILHGCAGGGRALEKWAERLSAWGYASVTPNSYHPRGVSDVCAGPAERRTVTPQDRAGDVVSTALWLRTRPEIDGNRIGVIGFSNGGWTAMWATQRRYELLYPGLIKAAVSYYGNCAHPEDHGTVPLLVLVGEADDWDDPAENCRNFGAQLNPDQPFSLHTYPGVVHSFDDFTIPYLWFNEGHPLQYSSSATADSLIRTKAFFDYYVNALSQ